MHIVNILNEIEKLHALIRGDYNACSSESDAESMIDDNKKQNCSCNDCCRILRLDAGMDWSSDRVGC